jgi:gas vesicle protein
MNKTGKTLLAIATGAVAGIIIGVLFAPDKGSETRRKSREEGEKLADNIKNKFCGAKEKFNDRKEDIGQTFKEKVI